MTLEDSPDPVPNPPASDPIAAPDLLSTEPIPEGEEDEDGADEDEDDPWAEAASPEPVPAGIVRPKTLTFRFVVENECHGWRLDRYLQKKIRRLSRSRIQRIIAGECDVAGRPAKNGMRVFLDQQVSFTRPTPPEPEVPRNISIVMADPSFYVIDKPSGLPIHPTARYHFSTLTNVLHERYPDEPLQVAHRLDRETSGLMLVARDRPAGSFLKQAFARRLVSKRYLAIVHGRVEPDELLLDQPMAPDPVRVRVRMAVRPVSEGGLPAVTAVTVLRRGEHFTLVECRPHTGRQHQIRVHLNSIGHPIVGDKLYPDEELFIRWAEGGDEAVKGELLLPRHALHAAGIIFPHPRTGAPVEAVCPLPPDLLAFLEQQQV